MPILIQIPSGLRVECGGAREIQVSATTVREALAQLESDYPALYCGVCEETGAVRRHVNLFVNWTLLSRQDGFDTQLAAGDILTIMPAVSGG